MDIALDSGLTGRENIGAWVKRLVPVEALVPDVYSDWRPLVEDSLSFVFAHLSGERLAAKVAEQINLPHDTPPIRRLMKLISRMPGIQKFGQVIARNRYLEPSLKEALSELENGLSDVTPEIVHATIAAELGSALDRYAVHLEAGIFVEASVSAVVRFTWLNPESGERERGVFKVMKPYVPVSFAEDMTLLEGLSRFLSKDRRHEKGIREVSKTVAEVRLLLERELDFVREQATLLEAFRTYRFVSGIRVPGPIPLLSTPTITAMTDERGVKVTEAFRGNPERRRRIAAQLIEVLVAVPLLSREENALLHADPHAGNLLYDEQSREVILLDWALTERLSRDVRRHLAMLVIMTVLRDPAGVSGAIQALSLNARSDARRVRLIRNRVRRSFDERPAGDAPNALDAMRLLDQLAMEGIRFPASLAMFRKVLFTLDGVLNDVAGPDVRLDRAIVREYLLRLASSYGLYHSPLTLEDLVAVEQSALFYPVRRWAFARSGRGAVGCGRESAI